MSYAYSQGDRLLEPHKYMYTPFEGPGFLRAYFEDRAAVARGNSPGEALVDEARRALNARGGGWGEQGTSAALLERSARALLDGAGASEMSSALANLSEFVRKYEVSKKIHRRYPDGGRKGEGGHLEMAPYLLLALGCALQARLGGTLKYLNCLLKLGDLLVSRRVVLTADETALARPVLALETQLVRELMVRQGVTA